MKLTSGSIVHSSRSRHDEASGPIIKPPEQTQEKLPGLLRHSPPLHGFSRLMRITRVRFRRRCFVSRLMRITRVRFRCRCFEIMFFKTLPQALINVNASLPVKEQHVPRVTATGERSWRVDAEGVTASVAVGALVHVLAR